MEDDKTIANDTSDERTVARTADGKDRANEAIADDATVIISPDADDTSTTDPETVLQGQDVTAIGTDGATAGVSGGGNAPQSPPPLSQSFPNATVRPRRIAHFDILKELGSGGMGAVYLAEQHQPMYRKVALKLIHASLQNETELARFNLEREAMAKLSHPNVAALYEAGATEDGFPYFAMELVEGNTLHRYCDKHNLSIDDRVDLLIQVCHGVQHAHQKGVLHRDLKPGNLLVTEVEGKPVPKIIDFGIAKAIDEQLADGIDGLTGIFAIGTPGYISPEAALGGADVDTRTDVYALGVILYVLFTGTMPRDPVKHPQSADLGQATVSAPRPSTRLTEVGVEQREHLALKRQTSAGELADTVRGDLDWIVMKAIEDDPDRRYESAAAFADDLLRYRNNLPVVARPPSRRYILGKFVRRNRLAVAASAAVSIALIVGIFGTTTGLVRARQAEQEAVLEAQRSQAVTEFLTEIFNVSDPGESRGNSVTARELLDRGAERIRRDTLGQPLLQARLMETMGGVYGKLGLYEDAVVLAEEALAIEESLLGSNDIGVAGSVNALGDLYRLQAKYDAAETLHRRALAIREDALGSDHPDVADSVMSLGTDLVFKGDFDAGEALFRRALTIREQSLGAAHTSVATALARLGGLLIERGRFEEAEGLLNRALAIRLDALGEDHYLVADTLDSLASLYSYQGDYLKAEQLVTRALAVTERVMEPDHPDRGHRLMNLGSFYRLQGKNADAETTLNKAIDILEVSVGKNHLKVAFTLEELARLYADTGRWQDAAAAYSRQLVIYEERLGASHRGVGQVLNNLAWVFSDGLNEYERGERFARRAIAVFEAQSDSELYWQGLSQWTLANNLRDQQRYSDAHGHYLTARRMIEQSGGSQRAENLDLDQLLNDFAAMLRAAGQPEAADQLEM